MKHSMSNPIRRSIRPMRSVKPSVKSFFSSFIALLRKRALTVILAIGLWLIAIEGMDVISPLSIGLLLVLLVFTQLIANATAD